MSAFFLVSAVAAAIGALLPRWRGALLVPAALYGTALVGRLIGAASGDMVGPAIIQAMIVEALSLALMAGSWWVLSQPTVVAAGQAGDEASRSEEHTSELQSIMRNSYAGFCLK